MMKDGKKIPQKNYSVDGQNHYDSRLNGLGNKAEKKARLFLPPCIDMKFS